MAKRINRDDVDKLLDYDLHIPTRTITLFGEIHLEACERLVKNLHILDSVSDAPITILLNSDGGDVVHGQAVYEAIEAARSFVTIIGVGEVQSIAAAVFQAADLRIFRPLASFMIHNGTRELAGRVTDVKKTAKVFDESDRWYEEVLLARVREKHPKFPLAKLRLWLKDDTYFNHAEVVRWGLSDQ